MPAGGSRPVFSQFLPDSVGRWSARWCHRILTELLLPLYRPNSTASLFFVTGRRHGLCERQRQRIAFIRARLAALLHVGFANHDPCRSSAGIRSRKRPRKSMQNKNEYNGSRRSEF
jgi:hypothetical protein